MSTQHPTPTPPVESGPQTAIPQTDIPHMGTSQANVAKPEIAGNPQPTPQAQTQSQPTVSQEAIDAAIAQVQKTGSTDGIAPEVLAAACAQIEAQAAAEGIDLQAQAGPTNYVEAAVMDKKGTIDGFAQQRDAMKEAVAGQRDAMQQPYQDALAKAGMGSDSSISPEQMAQLAAAVKDLDPGTVALINAIGLMSSNPSILNSVIWIEIIRAIRRLISNEAKKHVHAEMHQHPA